MHPQLCTSESFKVSAETASAVIFCGTLVKQNMSKKEPKRRNPVAKFAHTFNKAKIQHSKKSKAKSRKEKHKNVLQLTND